MPAPPWPALIRDRVRGSQAGRPPARATTDASRSGGLAWLEAAWAVAGLDGLGGGRPALRAAQGAGERLPHDRDMQPHRLAEHRPEPRRVRNRAGLAEAGDNLAAGRLQGDDVEMVPARREPQLVADAKISRAAGDAGRLGRQRAQRA